MLTGDYRQVPEIEAGGSFRALASALDAPELTQNRRQAETWEREALAQLRSGAPAKAVEAYVEHGRVVVAGTAPEARRVLVADWWRAKQRGDDAVMFAIARSDVEALNRLARELAKKADHLVGPELDAGGRTYAVGDEVITLRPDRRLGVINGTRAQVVSVEWGERSLTALTKTGHELTLTSDYLDAGHLGWGYASTLHKGQGSTVDRAFLLGGDGLYREAGYTGLSRGRTSNDLYLVKGGSFEVETHLPAVPVRDAVEALVSGLGRSRAQELAMSGELGAAPPARRVGQPSRTTAAQVVQAEQLELLPSGTPGYLVAETGSIPAEPGARRRLERAEAAVERYRARHGIRHELDPIGPEPEGDPWRLLEHRRVARIIDQVRRGRAPDRSIGEDMGP